MSYAGLVIELLGIQIGQAYVEEHKDRVDNRKGSRDDRRRLIPVRGYVALGNRAANTKPPETENSPMPNMPKYMSWTRSSGANIISPKTFD